MQRRIALVFSGLALVLAGVGGMTGCSSDSRLDEVRADPSPNIDSLHQRPDDIDNAMTVTCDENLRAFWQDMGRFWLLDRPTHLTREPHLRP